MEKYRTYRVRQGLVLKGLEEYEYQLHYKGYEWAQIKWLQYTEKHASIPFTIGRSILKMRDATFNPSKIYLGISMSDLIKIKMDNWIKSKEEGQVRIIQRPPHGLDKYFSKEEWNIETQHTLKVDINQFGGEVRVYQKVYKLALQISDFVGDFTIRANEIAVGGGQALKDPPDGEGWIEVEQAS